MDPGSMPRQDDDPVLAEGDGFNRKQRRQHARAARQAGKQSAELVGICRRLDTLAAIDWMARRNKGKRLDQFEALIAIHRTRLSLPGMTEEESATSLAWLREQRLEPTA